MFDSYKYLTGKKGQLEKKGLLDFLLRPYRILFKDSNEEPKEAGIKEVEQSEQKQVEQSNMVEQPKPEKSIKLSSKPRAGKVLWKKK